MPELADHDRKKFCTTALVLCVALGCGSGSVQPAEAPTVVESSAAEATPPTAVPTAAGVRPAGGSEQPAIDAALVEAQPKEAQAAGQSSPTKLNPFLVVAPPAPRSPTAEELAAEQQSRETERIAAAEAAIAPEFKRFQLKRPGTLFAFSSELQRLVVVPKPPRQLDVYAFNNDLRFLKTVPIDMEASTLLVKRYGRKSYVCLGGEGASSLLIYDLKELEPLPPGGQQNEAINTLAAAGIESDPGIYYSNKESRVHKHAIGRYNLATGQDEGVIGNTRAPEITISYTGDFLYSNGDNVRRIIPSLGGPEAMASRVTLENTEHDLSSDRPIAVDPHGAYVASANSLLTASCERTIAEFPFTIRCFAHGQPWLAGISEADLYVGSVNDGKVIAKYRLPPKFLREVGVDTSRIYDPRRQAAVAKGIRARNPPPFFYDEKADRLIAAEADEVAVLPLKTIDLPDESLLAMTPERPAVFDANTPGRIRLQSSVSGLTARLIDAPPGIEFRGDELRWKPDPNTVGSRVVVLQTSLGEQTLDQDLPIAVLRKRLSLPAAPKSVALSADASRAVALIDKPGSNDRKITIVALIDTIQLEVLLQKEFPRDFQAAAIGAESVYLLSPRPDEAAGAGSADLLELRAEDLSLTNSVEVSGGPLALAGEEFLVVGDSKYSTSGLKPLSEAVRRSAGRRRAPVTSEVEGGWELGGVVWQTKRKRAAALLYTDDFIQERTTRDRPVSFSTWGCRIEGADLKSSTGKRLVAANDLAVPAFAPFSLAIGARNSSSRGSRHDEGGERAVTAHDLLTGKTLQKVTLDRSRAIPRSGESSHLLTAGNTVLAIFDSHVFTLRGDEFGRVKSPEPFRFEMRQPGLVLPPRGEHNLKYELIAGEGPYQAKLRLGRSTAESSSDRYGAFRIDSGEIAENALAKVARAAWPNYTDPLSSEPRDRVIDYIRRIDPWFKKLVGRRPKGVPFAVPVVVEATDKQAQTARFEHVFLVELPAAKVVQSLVGPSRGRSARVTQRSSRTDRGRSADRSSGESTRERLARKRELDLELAVGYSDDLREAHPPEEVSDEEFTARAEAAREKITRSLSRGVDQAQEGLSKRVRKWADKKGHTTRASMLAVIADQVVLRLASGSEVNVPLSKLSDKDRSFIAATRKPIRFGERTHAELQLSTLADIVRRHVRRTSTYPPAYLVDAQGEPLLSWRVALLADMDGADLLRLMHLDEPWDSAHNRKLLPYMPAVFATDPTATAEGKATLLALTGSHAMLTDGRPRALRELTDAPNQVPLLVEVRPESAVPWSKPEDVDDGDFDGLPERLVDRGRGALVAVAGGATRLAPLDTPSWAWRRAVNPADGHDDDISFVD